MAIRYKGVARPASILTRNVAIGAVRRLAVMGAGATLVVSACGQSSPVLSAAPSDEPSASASSSAGVPSAPAASPDGTPAVTLVQFADTADPSAAAERERELDRQARDDAGMPALVGPNGEAAFTALDAIEEEFARELLVEVAAAIDAGGIPQDATSALPGMLASTGDAPAQLPKPVNGIDISLFANTGFTASAIMAMYAGIIQQAAQSQSGTLPRNETFDKTDPATGLRQQVTLNTTFVIETGGGMVSADIIMSATDNITDAASGSFVALYTSRSTGHFDVSACPDENGVAEGTYTFETKHELNDVSTQTASRSGAGRRVDAPFRLINGDDAHLQQIEAVFDLQADGYGPGSPAGPGPTAPFDWGATQQVSMVMPVNGSTTVTGATGVSTTGTGGAGAGGAMFISSAMAQLFLAQVGKEAETFWRKGECIEINTTEESRKVAPGEAIELGAEAVGKFEGEQVETPITAAFTGKESLEPTDSPVDPPAHFDFVAGLKVDDKGTIKLEQVGKRGIGRKTVEFTVGVDDYRFNLSVQAGGYSGLKCDGHEGAWTVNKQAPDQQGTITFTIPEDAISAEAHAVYNLASGGATTKWDMKGTATFVPGDSEQPPKLSFSMMTGTATVKAFGQTITTDTEQLPFDLPLEPGDFC